MEKTELRRLIRQKKRALTPEQIETASDRLAERLFRHPLYRQARTVYLYLSCNQEVRTAPILRRALADGARAASGAGLWRRRRAAWLWRRVLRPVFAAGAAASDPCALL